jgi:hypothetical protein
MPMPRVLGGSKGSWRSLVGEVSLYLNLGTNFMRKDLLGYSRRAL